MQLYPSRLDARVAVALNARGIALRIRRARNLGSSYRNAKLECLSHIPRIGYLSELLALSSTGVTILIVAFVFAAF
jgi:hypothetical protein